MTRLAALLGALVGYSLLTPHVLAETRIEKLLFEVASSPPEEHGPASILLHGRDARWQLQVVRHIGSSELRDATHSVTYRVEPPAIVDVDATGFVTPRSNGEALIVATDGDGDSITTNVRIRVTGLEQTQPVSFVHQVVPIFTKLGCNGGGCHGKAVGQAGFRLSLLGFEPQEDYQHLVYESRGRRLFPAVPSNSLILQKAVNRSPHGGGQRLEPDSHEFRVIERWIAGGMPYAADNAPTVTRIEARPDVRRLALEQTQQLSVVAHYSNGRIEDITRAALYESNNIELAEVDSHGLVSLGKQSGIVAIMARYQGHVAVSRLLVPLGADIHTYPEPNNQIDKLVFKNLATLGIPTSALCDDSTFIRRVTLDLAGRLPTVNETETFLDDASEAKDAHLVDRLLDSTDYADFFAKKWSTILRNRRTKPGYQFGTFAFHDWLRTSFHENKPYDQLVRELITASGSVETNPPVAWLREVNNTESRLEDTAQLFLGQRLQCARCHHHPFEKWSQTDYFQMAAFFSKVTRKEGENPDEPIFVSRLGGASARNPRSGENCKPAGLDCKPLKVSPETDPRELLVDWMVAPDNPFFAKSLANRYWKHFLGAGLVEPEDDMRVTNPPSNPELLDGLADYFTQNRYDLKSLIRLICNSTVYRLSSEPNELNVGDRHSYSRFYPRRLQAEVLLDAIDQIAQTNTPFGGMPLASRAVSLPDTSFESYFLDVFGKPQSATACECERSDEATLAQSLHLLNSKQVQAKLASDSGRSAAMSASSEAPDNVVRELYLAAYSRAPSDSELKTINEFLTGKEDRRREAFEDIMWAVINSKEFLFIR